MEHGRSGADQRIRLSTTGMERACTYRIPTEELKFRSASCLLIDFPKVSMETSAPPVLGKEKADEQLSQPLLSRRG